jgi:hypothetical protein
MPKVITLQQLKEFNACKSQRILFKENFGDSVEISQELCVKFAQHFQFTWAAAALLSAKNYAKFRKLREKSWHNFMQAPLSSKKEKLMLERNNRVEARVFAKLFLSQK